VWLRLLTLLAVWCCAGALGIALIVSAPGYGIDERELDTRLSAESVAELRRAAGGATGVGAAMWEYLGRLAGGDLGESLTLHRPVGELVAERFPVTLGSVLRGLLLAWLAGLGLAVAADRLGHPLPEAAATGLAGLFLCLPVALVALAFTWFGAPPEWPIAVAVFPKIQRVARNLLAEAGRSQFALAARARGLPEWRVLAGTKLPLIAAPLVSLAGVTASAGFAAAIPVEVFSNSPGLGQLAWLSAQGRDLPVLVVVTLSLAGVTLGANCGAELLVGRWRAPGP
jgi:peptide/nickel transport system permease protein